MSSDREILKKLYILLVRPHLEYAFQVRCPYLVIDIEALENVQRRASKIPEKSCRLYYQVIFKACGIPKLSNIRVSGNLIQNYKVLNNLKEINWYKGPILATYPHEKCQW